MVGLRLVPLTFLAEMDAPDNYTGCNAFPQSRRAESPSVTHTEHMRRRRLPQHTTIRYITFIFICDNIDRAVTLKSMSHWVYSHFTQHSHNFDFRELHNLLLLRVFTAIALHLQLNVEDAAVQLRPARRPLALRVDSVAVGDATHVDSDTCYAISALRATLSHSAVCYCGPNWAHRVSNSISIGKSSDFVLRGSNSKRRVVVGGHSVCAPWVHT